MSHCTSAAAFPKATITRIDHAEFESRTRDPTDDHLDDDQERFKAEAIEECTLEAVGIAKFRSIIWLGQSKFEVTTEDELLKLIARY